MYYFNFVVLADGQAKFLPQALHGEKADLLKAYITRVFGESASATYAEIVRRVGILESAPLLAEGDALRIILPRYDQKKCGG